MITAAQYESLYIFISIGILSIQNYNISLLYIIELKKITFVNIFSIHFSPMLLTLLPFHFSPSHIHDSFEIGMALVVAFGAVQVGPSFVSEDERGCGDSVEDHRFLTDANRRINSSKLLQLLNAKSLKVFVG